MSLSKQQLRGKIAMVRLVDPTDTTVLGQIGSDALNQIDHLIDEYVGTVKRDAFAWCYQQGLVNDETRQAFKELNEELNSRRAGIGGDKDG